ncbi:hypothetical protein M404DRAFT_290723 [Pisolithus tinctorius Marx 270]|uniref:Uncharacterized protein n=1 Tax=Pisolithus tinctorius Marx 270 TaxID=870435 RepID=A0A0C3PLZ4_PISTI|nr:hypothetical protein M404DRAFT_290723 [Pisolithus tinctorius Marx 270]
MLALVGSGQHYPSICAPCTGDSCWSVGFANRWKPLNTYYNTGDLNRKPAHTYPIRSTPNLAQLKVASSSHDKHTSRTCTVVHTLAACRS